jgi:hypothetical protein
LKESIGLLQIGKFLLDLLPLKETRRQFPGLEGLLQIFSQLILTAIFQANFEGQLFLLKFNLIGLR